MSVIVKKMSEIENNFGTPAHLWGPPMWKVLYSVLYCAQEYLRNERPTPPFTYPSVKFGFMKRKSVEDACCLLLTNLGCVLPCVSCRKHTLEFMYGKTKVCDSDVVVGRHALQSHVDMSRPYTTIQRLRAAVTERLDRQQCKTRCTRTSTSGKDINEITTIRLRSGLYFMTKLDLMCTAYFLDSSCRRRVNHGAVPSCMPNYKRFLRGLTTLLCLMGWMKQTPDPENVDILNIFQEFWPPHFEAWKQNMRREVEQWVASVKASS